MDNTDSDEIYRRPAAPASPTFPSISDYWPDAPHRIGPPADHYSDEPTAASVDSLLRKSRTFHPVAATSAPPPPRRRGRRVYGFVLAAVLLAGAGLFVAKVARDQEREPGPVRAAPTPVTTTPNSLSAPARGRTEARFELVSDTATIDLSTAALGADLYRISTPERGSVVPRATIGDTGVRLFLDDNGERGDAAVKVLLNTDVRWSLRISGGVRQGVFDLGGAKVGTVDFAGGAARIDLTLPAPDGTLPIRMSGGVNRFEVRTGRDVPVRVRTRKGAGQVKLDGRTDDGVARGAAFLSPGWSRSTDRIDLDAVAGVGTLRVGRG
ncbi:hypothetical protein [Actinoplanes friuliensis]|uniref:Cell wall-active antibiotics response LiaF-like C-terminal domain-containing protein n=1 Tax=Actinoplanes friuliensis DSM 7358 TaxID=1246995 RepID=U5VYI3_9ACTN|nr:hypothetical protein [Actinoplanes friuliensis]AGZ41842.1 hypothetical protein AFR_17820 [Actinoplanes friuliensis DSM 7358]